MIQGKTGKRPGVAEIIESYGKCLELVPTDSHFEGITVALYVKEDVLTVWSFSTKPGTKERLETIRDQMVSLGGLVPVEGSYNQVVFPCGVLHERPVKFLVTQAVGKSPEYALPVGEMSIRDSKSSLMLSVAGHQIEGKWLYRVSGEGEVPNAPLRLRMVVAGFLRYGEMDKASDDEVTFSCGQRHDELVRLLLPYSRNISAVESMMEAEAARGQMTTSTLGFSPL